MTSAVAEITEPIPAVPGDAGYPTRVLFMPVFVDGGDRRRRMVMRGRYLAATACLAHPVMLGVSITASPVSKRAGGAPGTPVKGKSGNGAGAGGGARLALSTLTRKA